MGNKSNTNYDHLDKILREAGMAPGQGSGGTWVIDKDHPEGYWVVNSETLDQLRKSADDIERYLRS